jgi:hypothetical protein
MWQLGLNPSQRASSLPGILVYILREIGSRPGPGHSLARVDNGGNHEPGNVRWTTPGRARPEQAPLGSRATR